MSRPPSIQQTSANKSQNSLPYAINESIQRSFANNNPYLSLNNVQSAHQFNANIRDMRPLSSSQELKPTSNFNSSHSIEQAQTNMFNNMSRKPSLLSGYHNPFSSPERNDLLFSGIPHGMSQNRFFPSSNTSSQSNDIHFNSNASSAAAAAAMSAYFNGLNTGQKYANNNTTNNSNNSINSSSSSRNMLAYEEKTNSKHNSANNSNQTALRSVNSQPNMNLHQPNNLSAINQPSQLTPAIISAAASALSSMGIGPTHPHYTQLIQQQFQLHLQQNQLKSFVNQSNEKKDLLTSKPPIPMSNSSPHAQILKPNIQQQQTGSQSSSNQNSLISTSSSSTSSSSSYVPQVEAISPTPEDHKENSNLQALKEKICSEIEKVDKDYASTQYQLEMLKKKQIELEKLQNKPILDENSDKTSRPKELTLAEKIYKENKKKAEESHREILKPIHANKENIEMDNNLDELIPLYHEYSDTKIFKETRISFEKLMKNKLVKYFKRQILLKNQREKILIDKYDSLHTNWSKKVDKLENSSRKKQKDIKSREFYEKFFPEIRKQREERERLLQKQAQPTSTIQNSTTNQQTTGTDSQTTPEVNPLEEERKRVFQLAVVPPSCFDSKQKKYTFIDNNGFVSDPVSLFKAVKNEVYWDEKEKAIFLEKLLTFGKNFEIIASYLDKKRVQDCIEYYYLTKKKVNYKLLIRKHQRKRKKDTKLNPNSSNNNSGNGNSGSGNGSSNNNATSFGFNNQTNNSQNTNQTNNTNSNSSNNPGNYATGTNQLSSLNAHESILNTNEQVYQRFCENNQNNLPNENVSFSNTNNTMFNGILDELSNTSNHRGNIKQTAENSSDRNGDPNGKDIPNSSSKEVITTNIDKNNDQQDQSNSNQEKKREEENDEDDGNEGKRDKQSPTKAKIKKKTDCCACKKSDAKKKGKNKIRIRRLSNKVQFLDQNQKDLLKSEFNINIKSNCDEPKFRLCLSCFKKISNRLNQFFNQKNASNNTENESKNGVAELITEKLEAVGSDSKNSDEKHEHESNENVTSGDSTHNSEKQSEEDYYDYDDEDSNSDEATKNDDIQAKAEDKSDSVDRKASKRKLENVNSNHGANNDSNNNLLFSKDLNILSHISNLINSETNNQTVEDELRKNCSTSSSNERSILKEQPKQISDIINDAIKSALHNNQDPLELITKSKLPTNIDLLSSLTKNEISLSSFLTNFQQLVQTTKESEKQSNEASNDMENVKTFLETKNTNERLTSNLQKQQKSTFNVLNELISKHKDELKASEESMKQSVANESKETPEQQEKTNINKNYTLGKWVDAIISKMNVPSDIELDINDPMIRSNFAVSKPNHSIVNEKEDSNESVQSDSNQRKVKIDSNTAAYSQNDERAFEKEFENESLNKKFRFSSDNSFNIQNVNEAKQRSQTEIPISNIIKNEMKLNEESNVFIREKNGRVSQQNSMMEEKGSHSKSPMKAPISVGDPTPSSGSGDVWNNMFGGIIMNSLLQDLPPALSIPSNIQEQVSCKFNRNRSNQSPIQSQNLTNQKLTYNEKELTAQFQTGPSNQNVPQMPARQTKDLLFQARSYAPHPNVPSSANPSKPNKSSNLQSQQTILDPFAEQKAYNSLIESLSSLNPQTILELINTNQLPNFIKSLGFNNENQIPPKTISPGHSNQLSSQIHAQLKEIDKQQAFSMPKHNSNQSMYSSHMNNSLLSPPSASPQIISTRVGSQSSPFNSSSIVHNAPHHTNMPNSLSNDKHSLIQSSNNGSNINNNVALSSFMSSAMFQNNPNMPIDPIMIQQLINSGNFNFPNAYPSNEHQLSKQPMPIIPGQFNNSANSSSYDLGQRFHHSPQSNNNFNSKLSHPINQTVNSQNSDNHLKHTHMLHRQSQNQSTQNHSKQHDMTDTHDLIQQFYQNQLMNHHQQQVNYKKRMLASNETSSSTTQLPNPIQSKPEKSAHSLTKKI